MKIKWHDAGHMIKMAAMPIDVKNLLKSSPEPCPMILKFDM